MPDDIPRRRLTIADLKPTARIPEALQQMATRPKHPRRARQIRGAQTRREGDADDV
jgi:hypothetical protein